MLLAEVTQSRVFLDSDDVSKLDAIINVTAWDSATRRNRGEIMRKHEKTIEISGFLQFSPIIPLGTAFLRGERGGAYDL